MPVLSEDGPILIDNEKGVYLKMSEISTIAKSKRGSRQDNLQP